MVTKNEYTVHCFANGREVVTIFDALGENKNMVYHMNVDELKELDKKVCDNITSAVSNYFASENNKVDFI